MKGEHEVEGLIRSQIKGSTAYEHIKTIVNITRKYIGKCGRLAGTPGNNETIEYLKNEFEKAGIEVNMQEIRNLKSWSEDYSSIELTQPVYQSLTCCAVPGSGSTPDTGIEGEIIYIGRGIPDEYEGKDLRNKIIFHDPPEVRRTDNPMTYSVIDRPIEMGAIGVIEYSEITGHILQPRALGPQGVSVPVVCVTYEDALFIKELMQQWYAIPTGFLVTEKIPVRARIKVKTSVKQGVTYNVIGTVKGAKYPDEKVVLVAHHDAIHVSPGANDNASSLSVMIELAKIFSKLPTPKRTIVFAAVTGEECGYIGAKHFVDQHRDKLDNLKACITLDIIGSGDKQLYVTENAYEGKVVRSTEWLDRKIVKIAEELGYYIEAGTVDYAADNGPFEDAGVPTSYLGASMRICWPFLHTYLDDIDAIDPNRLKTIGDIVGVALWRLANAEEVKEA